jgi:hypothetical protein
MFIQHKKFQLLVKTIHENDCITMIFYINRTYITHPGY